MGDVQAAGVDPKEEGEERRSQSDEESFPHVVGGRVLAEWTDGTIYFAKVKRIYPHARKCLLEFDDRSTGDVSFSQIYSGEFHAEGTRGKAEK